MRPFRGAMLSARMNLMKDNLVRLRRNIERELKKMKIGARAAARKSVKTSEGESARFLKR